MNKLSIVTSLITNSRGLSGVHVVFIIIFLISGVIKVSFHSSNNVIVNQIVFLVINLEIDLVVEF